MFDTTNRRNVLALITGGVSFAALGACGSSPAEAKSYPVSYTEAQWRKRLTKQEFNILRQEATERPYSSPLLKQNSAGTFTCAGCANRVYSSKTKYDSGTGWPSFWAAIDGAVGTSRDLKLGFPRTEVHCARCGGHLGHIFNDGPKPTGKRHCINGAAMNFVAA